MSPPIWSLCKVKLAMQSLCLPSKTNDNPKENCLTTKTKVCYSLGHVLNDFCSALWFTYLLVFFQYVLKIESADAGALLLIGQIIDGITTPLVGIQIGRRQSQTCVCGKPFKGWHVAGTICVLASFPFLFLPCFGCESYGRMGLLVWYGGFVVLAQVGWAIVQISHMALIPILATTDSERVEISAYKNAAGFIACVIVYVIAWLIFGLKAGTDAVNETNANQFYEISFVCHGIGIVCTIAFWIGIQEPVIEDKVPELSGNTACGASEEKKKSKYGHWFTKAAFYVNLVVFTSSRVFGNLAQVYLPMYLQVTLSLPPITLATVPMTLYISGFLTSMCVKKLQQFVSPKIIIWGAVTLGFSASAGVWFGDGWVFRTFLIYGVAAFFGASGSLIYIMSLASTANLIGDEKESSGFVYGFYSFADKVSNGLAVFTIQYLHPKMESILCVEFYRWVLSISCSVALFLTLITQVVPLAKIKKYILDGQGPAKL